MKTNIILILIKLLKILDIVKKEAYADLYIPCLLAGFCGLRISEICGVELQYISELITPATEIERSVYAKLTYRF